MATIYKIPGGGQKVQSNIQKGADTEYVRVENSDWVEKYGCNGQDFYGNTMWSDDLETLQRWADVWAGCKVRLVEVADKEAEYME
ncbi:hypothetical protein [Phocaeicola dorei]|uniref:hypothetical protein n=1 Tax=Phocaeicola dorei TaxID=357276 RepID=UPI001F173E9B|nr:hypothetical protein [Phocaeicola dorei]MCE8858276.1 hypothetical protein [Phocaeicola dorei]